ncbi:MAG: transposase [candidate division NC10 bacterium]|jgi:REP element-mobilizing transposase RayT
MSRPLRIEYSGAWYHVMNRGAGRRTIFRSDRDRYTFLSLLGDITAIFGVELHAYCLMANHYHLLIHTPRANLSRAMRHLNGVYTQAYNRSYRTDGPLFRGRFKAILVDADNYLAQLSRYIHLNPVMGGVATSAHRDTWSSYPAYLGHDSPPVWLQLQPTLGLFGERGSRSRYQAFVEQGVDEEIRTFYSQERLSPVLGREDFQRSLARHRKAKQRDPEIPEAKRLGPRPSLAVIAQAIAQHFGIERSDLYRESRGRGNTNAPRAVAMALSRRPAGYSLKEIAEALRVSHYSSISVAIRRLRDRLDTDRQLAKTVDRIRKSLFEE